MEASHRSTTSNTRPLYQKQHSEPQYQHSDSQYARLPLGQRDPSADVQGNNHYDGSSQAPIPSYNQVIRGEGQNPPAYTGFALQYNGQNYTDSNVRKSLYTKQLSKAHNDRVLYSSGHPTSLQDPLSHPLSNNPSNPYSQSISLDQSEIPYNQSYQNRASLSKSTNQIYTQNPSSRALTPSIHPYSHQSQSSLVQSNAPPSQGNFSNQVADPNSRKYAQLQFNVPIIGQEIDV